MKTHHFYHKGRVFMEEYREESETFACLLPTGEYWNGFACPFFTKEEADRVAEHFRHEPYNNTVTYDQENDQFNFDTNDGMPLDSSGSVIIKGEKYYPIGAWGWAWDEARQCQNCDRVLPMGGEEDYCDTCPHV